MKNFTWAVLLSLLAGAGACAAEVPASLQGLGLRESSTASRDLPGWKKPEKILVRTMFGPQILEPLRAAAPGVELVPVTSVAEAVQAVSGAQAVIGYCEQEIFANADQLRWVQVYFAGVENCVSLPGIKSGILLSNGQRLSSPTIADHTMALTYALVRGIDSYHAEQANANWNPNAATAIRSFGELSGRTMLVVGLGGIGTQVAKRAHALGDAGTGDQGQ
ncbi:MAG: NAD(P)-dependent oxidoreductase [Lysobacterales bacterium]